jgi:hypothetical protein
MRPAAFADHDPPKRRDAAIGIVSLCVSAFRCFVGGCVAAICLVSPNAAQAQSREFSLRGFADVGSTTFTAGESFTAVLGSDGGMVFGGGAEAVFLQRGFIGVRASRFGRTGERVFLFGRERFGLGIPATVSVTPVEITAGYRFDYGWRVVPYAGGGLGWHRYTEASSFADGAEDVSERFQGRHLVAGAEIRLRSWMGTAVEAQWATVPDALGADPNSVSREFNESNLGGATIRLKVIVGR